MLVIAIYMPLLAVTAELEANAYHSHLSKGTDDDWLSMRSPCSKEHHETTTLLSGKLGGLGGRSGSQNTAGKNGERSSHSPIFQQTPPSIIHPSAGMHQYLHQSPHQNHPHHSSNAAVSSQHYRTKICPFLFGSRGECAKGRECSYAHTINELRTRPDLTKTKLCDAYMKGRCQEHHCKWAHGRHELRFTGDFFKTPLCKYWVESVCYAGSACRHAHGHTELRPGKLIPSLCSTTSSQKDGCDLMEDTLGNGHDHRVFLINQNSCATGSSHSPHIVSPPPSWSMLSPDGIKDILESEPSSAASPSGVLLPTHQQGPLANTTSTTTVLHLSSRSPRTSPPVHHHLLTQTSSVPSSPYYTMEVVDVGFQGAKSLCSLPITDLSPITTVEADWRPKETDMAYHCDNRNSTMTTLGSYQPSTKHTGEIKLDFVLEDTPSVSIVHRQNSIVSLQTTADYSSPKLSKEHRAFRCNTEDDSGKFFARTPEENDLESLGLLLSSNSGSTLQLTPQLSPHQTVGLSFGVVSNDDVPTVTSLSPHNGIETHHSSGGPLLIASISCPSTTKTLLRGTTSISGAGGGMKPQVTEISVVSSADQRQEETQTPLSTVGQPTGHEIESSLQHEIDSIPQSHTTNLDMDNVSNLSTRTVIKEQKQLQNVAMRASSDYYPEAILSQTLSNASIGDISDCELLYMQTSPVRQLRSTTLGRLIDLESAQHESSSFSDSQCSEYYQQMGYLDQNSWSRDALRLPRARRCTTGDTVWLNRHSTSPHHQFVPLTTLEDTPPMMNNLASRDLLNILRLRESESADDFFSYLGASDRAGLHEDISSSKLGSSIENASFGFSQQFESISTLETFESAMSRRLKTYGIPNNTLLDHQSLLSLLLTLGQKTTDHHSRSHDTVADVPEGGPKKNLAVRFEVDIDVNHKTNGGVTPDASETKDNDDNDPCYNGLI